MATTAYVPLGPFTNNSATPPINAQFLNGVEQQLVTLTTTVTNTVNSITGEYHIDQYGAVGDGTTVSRAGIQAAITAANTAYQNTGLRQGVYVPAGVFMVDAVTYTKADNTTFGAVSLMLLDGVDLHGIGKIKVKTGAYGSGAFYAIVRSNSNGVSHSSVRDITFDGNTPNMPASTQCSNILIEALTDVEVAHTYHPACNGQAIMVRGTPTTYATNIRIIDNRVDTASGIAIQSSQFDGLQIIGNLVGACNDNAIDVYGEAGSTTVHARDFVITGNRVRSAAVGIFLETCATGVVTGNSTYACSVAGIQVNRINGAPNDILITGNRFSFSPIGGYFTGDMTGTGVTFRSNTVVGASVAAVQLGAGGGNCSIVYILDNTLDTSPANSVPLVLAGSGTGGTVSLCRVRGTITVNTNRAYDYVVSSGTGTSGNTISAANAS